MSYLFTSESVSEGHPDKIADQISDALLDEFLRRDPEAKVACETLVTTGLVVLSGEVNTKDYVAVEKFVRETIGEIGYTNSDYQFEANSCAVISAIHPQSPDINRGVERQYPEEQGAGDQGMMFGYASKDTDDYLPLSLDLSHILLQELAKIRREGEVMTYLRPDAKAQVTIEYSDDNVPQRIDTIVVSTQHDEFDNDDERMLEKIREDVKKYLIRRAKKRLPERVQKLFKEDYKLFVNPTGKFVIGGPHGDTGLTGRKIIVDTYGGKGAHGGGAFSGKDASKVDRSAAYAARHIAKNMVAAGVAEEVLVQVAYAIGVAEPVGFYVNTYGKANVDLTDGEIAQKVQELFDMRPYSIIERFGLKYPIFKETAAYGHVGRKYRKDFVKLKYDGVDSEKEVEFFAWEKLDYVSKLKESFNL
ncbi:methionine adenosyltransferase [Balneicella halophila]|uniref:S-adenosylmethionine synthase n=1 Tax=Balneicella halophila TaxID=1537566 RepID=A0A7L4UP41_BALHA|nr:methionine adenosyltransferase [Balneicella halophila]PVX50885.1 methionine adenosyltransferase [Balneicella halophila]